MSFSRLLPAKPLTRDDARRIAANIAKLPGCCCAMAADARERQEHALSGTRLLLTVRPSPRSGLLVRPR